MQKVNADLHRSSILIFLLTVELLVLSSSLRFAVLSVNAHWMQKIVAHHTSCHHGETLNPLPWFYIWGLQLFAPDWHALTCCLLRRLSLKILCLTLFNENLSPGIQGGGEGNIAPMQEKGMFMFVLYCMYFCRVQLLILATPNIFGTYSGDPGLMEYGP